MVIAGCAPTSARLAQIALVTQEHRLEWVRCDQDTVVIIICIVIIIVVIAADIIIIIYFAAEVIIIISIFYSWYVDDDAGWSIDIIINGVASWSGRFQLRIMMLVEAVVSSWGKWC